MKRWQSLAIGRGKPSKLASSLVITSPSSSFNRSLGNARHRLRIKKMIKKIGRLLLLSCVVDFCCEIKFLFKYSEIALRYVRLMEAGKLEDSFDFYFLIFIIV